MVKKSIGIDIGRHHVRAVQVARTMDGLRIQKTFGLQIRRSTDSPADILRSLFSEHGFDRHAEVVASLLQHSVFYADVNADGPALEKLRAGDATMTKDSFPVEAGDTVVQVCSVHPAAAGHRVVLAAASRRSIEQELSMLKEANIRPAIIDTPIGAIQLSVATHHPETLKGTVLILHADESTLSLAVTEDGRLMMVRSIPIRSRRQQSDDESVRQVASLARSEIQITWRKAFGVEPDSQLRMYLVASSGMLQPLASAIKEQMECRVVPVNPYAGLAKPAGEPIGFSVCVAEGLALEAFATDRGERPNFFIAHRASAKPGVNPRKELAVCGCLAAAAILVWTVGLYLRLGRLEAQYATTKKQIEQIFRTTLPEEKNMVDPPAQIRQKLNSMRADRAAVDSSHPGQAGPLEVLYAIGSHPPNEGDLILDDMLITGDSVRLMGSCKSFTALSQWQHTLEQTPGMAVTEAPNTSKDASGKVHFSLSLSCGKAVQ